MSTIRLNPDRSIDFSGRTMTLISGSEEVSQRLSTKFLVLKGEWFRDSREGVPWTQTITKKGTDPALIRTLFRRLITRDPGVDNLLALNLSVDPVTRVATVTFTARLISGQVLVRGEDDPLLVDISEVL